MVSLPHTAQFEVLEETAWAGLCDELTRLGLDCPVWTFEGDLGAGKTTLIRALCDFWGVDDPVSSPSFAIINQYADRVGQPIHHIDLYRVKDEREFADLGLPDLLASGERCLIEWPALGEPWLAQPYFALLLAHRPGGGRDLTATRHA